MKVYTVEHDSPSIVHPQTTVVSRGPLAREQVVAEAARHHSGPVLRIGEHDLDFPPLSPDPGAALEQIRNRYAPTAVNPWDTGVQCARCHLCEDRMSVVLWRGNPDAAVLAVGEAPGRQEDIEGKPFVGASGHVANALLADSGIHPDHHLCWTNLVGCRPTKEHKLHDRPPSLVEKQACAERLVLTLRAVRPRVVICLGSEAAAMFWDEPPAPNSWHRIAAADGDYIIVGVARHPAYLLRVIGVPAAYNEFFAAQLFMRRLRKLLLSGPQKVRRWQWPIRYLSDLTITSGGPGYHERKK